MSRAHVRSIILLLVLVCLAGPALPAAGQSFALPIDPPLELPPEDDPEGHTPARVVPRADCGLWAVWTDITDERLLARRFGPDGVALASQAELVELLPAGSVGTELEAVGAASGGEGFLVVATDPPGLPRPPGLLARAFDAAGEPVGGGHAVAVGPVGDFALAGRPAGGYVVAWWGVEGDLPVLRFRFLDGAGRPVGSSVRVVELEERQFIQYVHLAVAPDGRFLVTWSFWSDATKGGPIVASSFGPAGEELAAEVVLVDELPSSHSLRHDVASVGEEDRFLLAWVAPGAASTFVRPFDLAGDPLGSARSVGVDRDWIPESVAVTAGLDGRGVVTWIESRTGSSAERTLARWIDRTGAPRADAFTVVPEGFVDASGFGGVHSLDVARNDAARSFFGWGVSVDPGILPTAGHAYWSNGARRFEETLEECGPILSATFRTEPAPPVEGEPPRLVFEGLADCAEVSLVEATRTGSTIFVEAAAEPQICGTFPPFSYSLAVEPGPLGPGPYEAQLEIALPGGGVCARSFDFEVVPHEEPPPEEEPPPPAFAPLTSPELPGFRVWVVITPQGEAPIPGTAVADCIDETLCVAGALAGRAELFVRVIGPRPNGFLWPVLVKLTPSAVEVWIEQTASGDVQYYALPAAVPGEDVLPGLFDRHGFVPR